MFGLVESFIRKAEQLFHGGLVEFSCRCHSGRYGDANLFSIVGKEVILNIVA